MTDEELSEEIYSELRVCMVRSKLMLGPKFERVMAECAANILGIQGQMFPEVGFVVAGLAFAYMVGPKCVDFHEPGESEMELEELELHLKSSIMWYMLTDEPEDKLNELKAILK